ncbi:MAG TPA: hypothetical protein VGO45_09005 [Bacteroidia bacterium]|nr:hypothetical protein [Bacteroidia bacterium]
MNKLLWRIRLFLTHSGLAHVNSSHISIVVVGRNDNYGGDFPERLQATIDWNLRHLPGAELIYIEWNKIEEKESDCLWIEKRYPGAKCYVVPGNIHKEISTNPKMPVMEYFAKNIAMRRSSREWILMINADCFIGNDVIKNIGKLNRNYIYGTHYVSIKWDGKPIADYHMQMKENVVFGFAADRSLLAVVGNFILTHKQNWLNATGYDERLTNVRAGVDTNGVRQLLQQGLKTMVLGHHFHLDHPESIIHGVNQTHGSNAFNNIPYRNPENWGLVDYPLKQISERIWLLEKT